MLDYTQQLHKPIVLATHRTNPFCEHALVLPANPLLHPPALIRCYLCGRLRLSISGQTIVSSSPTSSPEMQRRPENAILPSTTGTSVRRDCRENDDKKIDPAASTPSSTPPSSSRTSSFDALAAVLLVQISSFSPESSLSGVCRATLSAIRKLHYKVNIRSCECIENLEEHMGLQESGALATGRVVTRITVLVGDQRVSVLRGADTPTLVLLDS